MPQFDYSKTTFVDLFGGGGSVFSNVLGKFRTVIYNDVIGDLVVCHSKMKINPSDFIDQVKSISPNTQNEFIELRLNYNKNKTPEGLYALMSSCTNNMMRFNKKFEFNQTYGKRKFNPNQEEKLRIYSEWLNRFDNIEFRNKRFDDLIIPKDSFVYIDPPYDNTEAGYNAYWSSVDTNKLIDVVYKIDNDGNSFAVSGLMGIHGSLGESVLINELSKKFNIIKLDFNYDKVAKSKNKESIEVLITNYNSTQSNKNLIDCFE